MWYLLFADEVTLLRAKITVCAWGLWGDTKPEVSLPHTFRKNETDKSHMCTHVSIKALFLVRCLYSQRSFCISIFTCKCTQTVMKVVLKRPLHHPKSLVTLWGTKKKRKPVCNVSDCKPPVRCCVDSFPTLVSIFGLPFKAAGSTPVVQLRRLTPLRWDEWKLAEWHSVSSSQRSQRSGVTDVSHCTHSHGRRPGCA